MRVIVRCGTASPDVSYNLSKGKVIDVFNKVHRASGSRTFAPALAARHGRLSAGGQLMGLSFNENKKTSQSDASKPRLSRKEVLGFARNHDTNSTIN